MFSAIPPVHHYERRATEAGVRSGVPSHTDRHHRGVCRTKNAGGHPLRTYVSFVFSSPEHEVLMVSYCGQWLSVVRRRASSVVRRQSSVVLRPSTFDVYTLETTFVT